MSPAGSSGAVPNVRIVGNMQMCIAPEDDKVSGRGQELRPSLVFTLPCTRVLGLNLGSGSRFDELAALLKADTVSGASVVARTAPDVVPQALIRLRAGSLEELRGDQAKAVDCSSLLNR